MLSKQLGASKENNLKMKYTALIVFLFIITVTYTEAKPRRIKQSGEISVFNNFIGSYFLDGHHSIAMFLLNKHFSDQLVLFRRMLSVLKERAKL